MSHHQATIKEQILLDLWQCPRVVKAISSIYPECLREDIRSDVFAVLCEYPEERLIAIQEKGSVSSYALMMIHHRAKGKNNSFYRKFRQGNAELPDEFPDDVNPGGFTDEHTKALENFGEWEIRVASHVAEFGSAKEAAANIGIPYEDMLSIMKAAKLRARILLDTKKYTSMQINYPIEIAVFGEFDTDQVQELVDGLKSLVSGVLSQTTLGNGKAVVFRPEKAEPKIIKVS
jgi:hypothetical protein